MAAYTPPEEKLRKLLKQLRIEKDLTQIQLADLVGEPQQVISKIEVASGACTQHSYSNTSRKALGSVLWNSRRDTRRRSSPAV